MRLDLYSNERLRERAGGGSCGVGYFQSMRVVCYYLRVNWKPNVVLLDKLKDAPGVVDGGRMLGENGIYY